MLAFLALIVVTNGDSSPPLSTCACTGGLDQSWTFPLNQGEPDVIRSTQDTTQCWSLADEHDYCDGPCIVLGPCMTAQEWAWIPTSNASLPNAIVLQVSDPNATRDDDGYCMQQNKRQLELQVWGCNSSDLGPSDLGMPWTVVSDNPDLPPTLQDTWSGLNLCVGPCSYSASATRSPSFSPSPTPINPPPPALTTCDCAQTEAPSQLWSIPPLGGQGKVVSFQDPTLCWGLVGPPGSGGCDGVCVTLQPCSSPAAGIFNRTTPPLGDLGTSYYSLVSANPAEAWWQDSNVWAVQENRGAGYVQVWPSNDQGSNSGEDWVSFGVDAKTSLQNEGDLDNGKNRCLDAAGPCSQSPSPSPSPSPTTPPPPITQSQTPTRTRTRTRTPTSTLAPPGGASSSSSSSSLTPGAATGVSFLVIGVVIGGGLWVFSTFFGGGPVLAALYGKVTGGIGGGAYKAVGGIPVQSGGGGAGFTAETAKARLKFAAPGEKTSLL